MAEKNAERVGSENLSSNEHTIFRRLLMDSPTVNLKNNCRRLTDEKQVSVDQKADLTAKGIVQFEFVTQRCD